LGKMLVGQLGGRAWAVIGQQMVYNCEALIFT
jgi:hypothetical protein